MADLYSLSLSVDPSGVTQGNQEATSSLDALGAAAEKNAASLDKVTARLDTQGQSVTRLVGTNEGLTKSQQFLLDNYAKLDAAGQRAVSSLTGYTGASMAAAEGAAAATTATTALAAAEGTAAAATTTLAAAQGKAAIGANMHGVGLGRIRMELSTFLGRVTDTVPMIDRLGSALGSMAIGQGPMIAIVAGLAAVGFAYQKITADSREAAKAAEDFAKTDAAMRAVSQTLGGASASAGLRVEGTPFIDVPAASEKIQKADEAIKGFQNDIARLYAQTPTFGALAPLHELIGETSSGSVTLEQFRGKLDAIAASPVGQFFHDQIEQVGRLGTNLLAARDALTQLEVAAARAQDNQTVSGLATVVRAGYATPAERSQAQSILANDKSMLAAGGLSLSDRVALTKTVEELTAAFEKGSKSEETYATASAHMHEALQTLTERVNGSKSVLQSFDDAVAKEEITLRKQPALLAEWSAAAATLRERLVALQMAKIDGAFLTASQYLPAGTNNLTTADHTTPNSMQVALPALDFTAYMKASASVVQQNNKEEAEAFGGLVESELKKMAPTTQSLMEQPFKNAIRSIQSDFGNFFANLFTPGQNAAAQFWTSFKTLALKTFGDILAADFMQNALGAVSKNGMATSLAGLVGIGAGAAPHADAAGQALFALPGGANAAGAGALASSAALGFVGVLGFIGASLLSQSATNEAAWRQFEDARVKWADSLNKLVLSLSGTTFEQAQANLSSQFSTLIQQALADAESAIKGSPAAMFGASGVGLFGKRTTDLPGGLSTDPAHLKKTIAAVEALVGHGKNLAQNREISALLSQLLAIQTQYQSSAPQATADYLKQEGFGIQGLVDRGLAATGQTRQAANQDFSLQQQKELDAATKQYGGDSAYVQILKQTQAQESAYREQQFQREQKDFATQTQARLLTAQGHAAEASAISLQLQQEQELRDAQAKGYDDATIAALKLAQAAETAAANAAAAEAATQAARSHLSEQFGLFGTSGQDQLKTLGDLYGFTGETRDQILGQYTKYSKGEELTATQQATNAHIVDYLKLLDSITSAATSSDTAATATQQTAEQQFVAGSVTGISYAQADTVISYLASLNVHAGASEAYLATLAGHPAFVAPTVGSLAPSAGAAASGGTTIVIQVTVPAGASDTAITAAAAAAIDQALARRATGYRASLGAPRTVS